MISRKLQHVGLCRYEVNSGRTSYVRYYCHIRPEGLPMVILGQLSRRLFHMTIMVIYQWLEPARQPAMVSVRHTCSCTGSRWCRTN